MFGEKISMQNTVRSIIAIFALLLFSLGCQRDDICPESTLTTPLLKISFYDNESPNDSIPKVPTNLRIRAVGIDEDYPLTGNSSEISIPLKTDVDLTTYQFILNDATATDSTAMGNTDVIAFTYARNQVYINRACSFKMSYVNLQAKLQPESQENDNWIKDIFVLTSTIEDETTTHISIYF
tara:strand:- start:2076 stop:2618 length:543 start_codon:yes stop_codon:yes gene_type:complete